MDLTLGKDRNTVNGCAEKKGLFSNYFCLPFPKKQKNANSQ